MFDTPGETADTLLNAARTHVIVAGKPGYAGYPAQAAG